MPNTIAKQDTNNTESASGVIINDFLKENFARIKKGARILCLGENEGNAAVFLAKNGFDVTEVNASRRDMDRSHALAHRERVSLKSTFMELSELAIKPLTWDAIVSIWCHPVTSVRRELHKNCVMGLSRGGLFLFEAYSQGQLKYRTGGPGDVSFLGTLPKVKEELAGLNLLLAQEISRPIHEGQGRQGTGAVIQIIGQKP